VILRGQVSKDQLQFESEIEKAAQKNRMKKKNKAKLENIPQPLFHSPQSKRALGDYAM